MIYFIGWAVITAALFAAYIATGAVHHDHEMEGLLGIVLWPLLIVAVPLAIVVGAPFALGFGIAWIVGWIKERRRGQGQ